MLLKPIPKPGKDHGKLKGYCFFTMQIPTGNLIESIVTKKLVHDLERRNLLSPAKEGKDKPKTDNSNNSNSNSNNNKMPGKRQQNSHAMSMNGSRGKNKLSRSCRSGR